jgi:hypothetical protein
VRDLTREVSRAEKQTITARLASKPPVKFHEVTLPNMPPRYAVEVASPPGWTVRLQKGGDVQLGSAKEKMVAQAK